MKCKLYISQGRILMNKILPQRLILALIGQQPCWFLRRSCLLLFLLFTTSASNRSQSLKDIIISMAKPVIQSPAGGGDGVGSKARTTFVQADSSCFRDLVQRLTGPSTNEAPATVKSPAPKPTQKLHERRKYNKPKIEIAKPVEFQFQAAFLPKVPSSPPILGTMSPGGGYCRSPWSCPASPSSVILLSPPSSLQASPISNPLPVGCSNKRATPSAIELNHGEEEKAIKEKRFYLHPSPRSKPRLAAEPELLPLFPLTSPTTSSKT